MYPRIITGLMFVPAIVARLVAANVPVFAHDATAGSRLPEIKAIAHVAVAIIISRTRASAVTRPNKTKFGARIAVFAGFFSLAGLANPMARR